MNVKRTMIYLTITVVVLTLLSTVLMLSTSGTSPIKLYWAVTCDGEDRCNLRVSGGNFIGEGNETNETNSTLPANNFIDSGSITAEAQAQIDKPTKVPWYQYRNRINTVSLGEENDIIVPANMYAWFYGMENLENIDFSYVDSSSVSTVSYLFYGCSSIRDLDLSPLRIPSTVAGTSDNVYTYTYIDTITTSNINYIIFEYGFWESTETGDSYYAEEVPTGTNVTYRNITPKFYYHIADETLTITSEPTSGYDWNYEGSANKWFDRYTGELKYQITNVVVKNFAPQSVRGLFADLTSVTNIEFVVENNVSTVNTSDAIDFTDLFYNCKKLQTLDLSNISTQNAIYPSDNAQLFANCISLRSVTINEYFDFPLNEGVWLDSHNHSYANGEIQTNVNETYTRRAIYWGVDSDKETLTISNNYVSGKYNGAFDYLEYDPYGDVSSVPWKSYASTIKTINLGGANDYIQPIIMDSWFKNFANVVSFDLTYLDTSLVDSMDSTFAGMKKLKSIDLSGLDFSSLIIAEFTFGNCTALEEINLEGFNPPLIEDIGEMFSGCSSLEEVDLSSFEGENLVYVAKLFEDCTSLKRLIIPKLVLDVNNFEYDSDYAGIFSGCNKISQITIGPSNAAFVKSLIGNPDSTYIEGANGKWYDTELNEYDVTELPEDKIGTYYANSPVEITIYDSETSNLLKKTMYAYGSKIKLNVSSSKPNKVTPITTAFTTGFDQTVDNINSNLTTTYKLVGYTDNTNTYEFDSEYVIKSNITMYTVYEEDTNTYDTITLPDIERFGYIFKGWSLEENATSGLKGAYTPTSSTRFYAVWEEIKHEYLDNTESVKYIIGRTKSLVFRIDADLSLFKDLYVGPNKLVRDTHYKATSGSTVLTFTEEGMQYLEDLGPGMYEIKAEFTDTNNLSVGSITLEEVGKHVLTIHYRYSGSRSDEKVFDDYNDSLEEDTPYSIQSRTKDYYKYDTEVVSGTMGKSNIEVTVTYTPINDKNKNNIADEEEPKEPENTSSNTNNNTNNSTNNEASPKTRDNILTYIILEIVSLVAAVIIFTRIKAQ